MTRSILHHAAGIAAVVLAAALVYAAFAFRTKDYGIVVAVAALAPSFHGLRHIRGLKWRTR